MAKGNNIAPMGNQWARLFSLPHVHMHTLHKIGRLVLYKHTFAVLEDVRCLGFVCAWIAYGMFLA